jgi:hypothetical protein
MTGLGSVQLGSKLLRGDPTVGVADDVGDLVPVGFDVEADADPAAVPDIRWYEETFGFGVDELALDALRGPGTKSFLPVRDRRPRSTS